MSRLELSGNAVRPRPKRCITDYEALHQKPSPTLPVFPSLLRDPQSQEQAMRMAPLGQLAVMAAIVATMAYFPLGLALIFLLHFAGLGFETLISFGGTFGTVAGLIAWWLLAFIAASVYAAVMFPWVNEAFGGREKK